MPALPSVWAEGKVTGLKARGGFEVDLVWEGKKLSSAVVKSTMGGNCRIRSVVPVPIKGVVVKVAEGKNPNPFFDFVMPGQPEISPSASLEEIDEKPIKKLLKEAIKLDSTFKKVS